jgi:hypothetical protein
MAYVGTVDAASFLIPPMPPMGAVSKEAPALPPGLRVLPADPVQVRCTPWRALFKVAMVTRLPFTSDRLPHSLPALTQFHVKATTVPMSRLLTLCEGSNEVRVRCFLHTDQHAPSGWYAKAEKTLKLPRPFEWREATSTTLDRTV